VGEGRETNPYTPKQGQYLAFIYYYTKIHGRPPAEADFQRFFRVTPPVVHQMIKALTARGFIDREPVFLDDPNLTLHSSYTIPSGTCPRTWRCSFVRFDRGLGDEGRYDAVIDAAEASTSMKARACIRIYGRNSRVTLMTNARVDSSDQRSPSAPVFRSSVYTTNSSLPGAHSHRSRKFPLTV
jgi:repressor LexA